MKYLFISFVSFSFTIGCNNAKDTSTGSQDAKLDTTIEKYSQVNFKIDLHTPTVGITNYTLVSNDIARDSSNAREIVQAKVILPLAMQKHDPKLFDSTLANGFVYRGEEALFNRIEYIQDRVNAKWMISDARYENMVIQFIDNYGILTYRNKITEKDEFGKDRLYLWFWTDIWVIEGGRWKLKVLQALN
ncbi:MAG: nuclear transport factor 2 family protein [Ferruginibacter sp.]